MIAEMKGGPFEISAMFNRDASTEIHREVRKFAKLVF